MGIMVSYGRYIHAPGKSNTQVTVDEINPTLITNNGIPSRQIYKSNPIGFKAPVVAIDDPNSRYHQKLA